MVHQKPTEAAQEIRARTNCAAVLILCFLRGTALCGETLGARRGGGTARAVNTTLLANITM